MLINSSHLGLKTAVEYQARCFRLINVPFEEQIHKTVF